MSLIKLKCGGKGPFLAVSILSGAISVFGQVSGLIYSLERNLDLYQTNISTCQMSGRSRLISGAISSIGFNIFFGKESLCRWKIKSSETTLAEDNIAN